MRLSLLLSFLLVGFVYGCTSAGYNRFIGRGTVTCDRKGSSPYDDTDYGVNCRDAGGAPIQCYCGLDCSDNDCGLNPNTGRPWRDYSTENPWNCGNDCDTCDEGFFRD